MNEPLPLDPLPLDDVLGIVERRRRRRARARAVAAPVLSVAAVGAAGLVVAALQVGSDAPPALTPAAPPTSRGAPAEPAPTGTPAPAPTIDPAWLDPGYLVGMGDTIVGDARSEQLIADADQLARVWGVQDYPGAKAIVAKADGTEVRIDPADPAGDDELADRFTGAGYTAADAETLARAWGTDSRTAQVMGGLLVELDLLDG